MRPRGWRILILALLVLVLGGCRPEADSRPTPPPVATATPTTQQRISALVQHAAGNVADTAPATITYGVPAQTLSILATITRMPAVSAGQEEVKTLCFHIQKALWLSGIPLKQVSVTVNGPIYGVYGDVTSSGYGGALLRAPTASTLDWGALTPDSAWAAYDMAWLTYDYSNDS